MRQTRRLLVAGDRPRATERGHCIVRVSIHALDDGRTFNALPRIHAQFDKKVLQCILYQSEMQLSKAMVQKRAEAEKKYINIAKDAHHLNLLLFPLFVSASPPTNHSSHFFSLFGRLRIPHPLIPSPFATFLVFTFPCQNSALDPVLFLFSFNQPWPLA